VLAVIYLAFNEGYTATKGDRLAREELCGEAIRLGRVLFALMPDEPEVLGLLALMVLIEARRPARVAPDGSLVPLYEQDRSLWDRALIAEGQQMVRSLLRRNAPGTYQIQAAINAVHDDAPTATATEWDQILTLYDQLLVFDPSPVVELNRAVALAEVEGPEPALAAIAALPLESYQPLHAVRADLLRRLGRFDEASAEYGTALAMTDNDAERRFLELARATMTER
jgi:RNA polymerase sigma-70 factor (ECF subfamily)